MHHAGPAAAPVSAPAITGLMMTPAQSVADITTVTSLTPQLAATVSDTATDTLTGTFEIEHDPAATGQGTSQIWAGSLDNVASGTQVGLTVPTAKLTDDWKVRWRARAANTTAATLSSPWPDRQALTVDVPASVSEPAVGALQVNPSQVIDGQILTTSLTPNLLAQVTSPAGGRLRAEVEVDPATMGQGTGQIWGYGLLCGFAARLSRVPDSALRA
ncbi:hypothetical protein [Streptosporangium sp. H16]|uniref:hypothetical protein n=1 Tax=Streptosporangium sp. H16 TaxID=3444184 RepID=UPI003F7A1B70